LGDEELLVAKEERRKSTGSAIEALTKLMKGKTKFDPAKPWKDPQPFEVFAAIERKDLIYLMEVRDRAFHVSGISS
jgi:hypothetical protein